LKAIFSSVGVTESEKQLFRVNFEKVALVRYDFYVWKYSSRSDGLFQNIKSVIAYTYARSVVDHEKLSEDELNDAIEQSMGGNAEPDEVKTYKEKLIDLWKTKVKPNPVNAVYTSYMKLHKVDNLAIIIFGSREKQGKQKATSAVGRYKMYDQLFLATQNASITVPTYEKARSLIPEEGEVVDARNIFNSKIQKGEWTGYHAEMIVLTAMFNTHTSNDIKNSTLENLKTFIEDQGGAEIFANAQPCKHCANFLQKIGITFNDTGDRKPSLTGWWNPLTDEVYSHGTPEFNKDIPGEPKV
jgi:hypothetical protein